MSRSHDDIEIVTRLLQEKERDLELTAQIGKELLDQNQHLETRVCELELEVRSVNDNLAQLSHELHQKNELVAVLTSDLDDNSENGTPTAIKSLNLELLQKKVAQLEEENKILRQEASQLAKETGEVEEQDKRLMANMSSQLQITTNHFDEIRNELERQKEENQLQHEQIVALTTRLTEAELRLHQLTTENEEQCSLLCITKENQNALAMELVDFKTRYQEVVSLLNDTQEQLRRARKRTQPIGRLCPISGSSAVQDGCLQYELMETQNYSDNSLDSGISMDRAQTPAAYKNVFETVKCVSRTNTFDSSAPHLGAMSMSSASQPMMSAFATQGQGGSVTSYSYRGGGTSIFSASNYPESSGFLRNRTFSRESIVSDGEEGYPPDAPAGTPGVPGAKDLEAALKRLTPAEVLSRRAMLQHAPAGTYNYDECATGGPLGCRTPDSIMSTGLSSSMSGLSSQQWRLPEKLQIIKPMEGSQTLGHWNKLATPTLSGLLEERPGVTIRGGRGLDDLGLQVYSLSDVEEDVEDNPGKRFQMSACIYTFTNSTVMHPDDGSMLFSVPQSQIASQMTSQTSSRQSSAPQTPRSSLSRRNSCSTFSVSLSLASMLNERGIKAVTPSALNTPCGPNFSPTVTPCNSPEGSPPRSMSPEPQFLNGLLTSGADLLRRKIVGEAEKQHKFRARNKITLSRLERRALKSIKILEKVESIGLDNIISPSSNAPSSSSAVSPLSSFQSSSNFYSTHSRSASPMAQLTSLKNLTTTGSGAEEVRIDREAIKAIINRGLSSDCLKSLADNQQALTVTSDGKSESRSLKTSPNGSVESKTLPSKTIAENRRRIGESVVENKTPEPINARVKQMQRQKSRRNLINGRQRPDLGKLGSMNNMRPDLGTVANNSGNVKEEKSNQSMGFVGTISSLLFGRKGGLL